MLVYKKKNSGKKNSLSANEQQKSNFRSLILKEKKINLAMSDEQIDIIVSHEVSLEDSHPSLTVSNLKSSLDIEKSSFFIKKYFSSKERYDRIS